MFLKIQNLHWVEVACQLFIIPGVMHTSHKQPMSHKQPVSLSGSCRTVKLPSSTVCTIYVPCVSTIPLPHAWVQRLPTPFSASSNKGKEGNTHPQLHPHLAWRLRRFPFCLQLFRHQPRLVHLAQEPVLHLSHRCICKQLSPHLCICLTLVRLALSPRNLRIPSFLRKVLALMIGFFESLHEVVRILLHLLFFGEQCRLDVRSSNCCCIRTLCSCGSDK